jgi:GT2 family glycosyltransferase
MMDVSVVIVNLNTKNLLQACLESVFAEGSGLRLEVIVVDNGSADGSVEMVRGRFPSVRLVVNATNEGFARPNNVGMSLAEGRFIFLLNSDATVHPGALGTLCAFLDANKEVGACGPRLEYPDGRVQRSVKGFPSLWTHICDMFLLDKIFPDSHMFGRGEMAYFSYDKAAEVDHVMAAAFLVRREVLSTVGLLDERFSIYYNDMDLCFRMKRRGWHISYVPHATVTHHLGKTVGVVNRDFSLHNELYNNVMLFYQNRYGRWAVPLYKLILAAGFIVRSVGWTGRWLFQRSEHARMMMKFSWKSFATGVRFWVPLPKRDRPT